MKIVTYSFHLCGSCNYNTCQELTSYQTHVVIHTTFLLHLSFAKSVLSYNQSHIFLTSYFIFLEVKNAVKNVQPARVAVLRATGNAVTAETTLAVTAAMVQELGMQNVVLQHGDFDKSAKTIPYSLETLASDDPDIIFVSTMGKKDEITKTMEKEMTGNPAWQNLKAVKNGKVFYLPSNWFLLNPGLQTPEAMAELVKMAYGIDVTF